MFKLTEHNQRLHKCAEILGFKAPYFVEELDSQRSSSWRARVFPMPMCVGSPGAAVR
jgi:branched-subunit amino acid aminotransferase/4-amino-4-deoxychorismate lyase